jgi:hypothetical protein
MGAAAINIAMCHGRIGDYQQQHAWAERALSLVRVTELQWKRHQAAYYRSLALCMLGENRKAIESLERFKEGHQNVGPGWNAQSVPLMTADIYMLAGESLRGTRIAMDGLGRTGFEPLSDAYAGMVARWVARISVESGAENEAMNMIGCMTENLESHDLLDQAEILCGRLLLEDCAGMEWEVGRVLLSDRLARLPSAVEDQLRRLGALR